MGSELRGVFGPAAAFISASSPACFMECSPPASLRGDRWDARVFQITCSPGVVRERREGCLGTSGKGTPNESQMSPGSHAARLELVYAVFFTGVPKTVCHHCPGRHCVGKASLSMKACCCCLPCPPSPACPGGMFSVLLSRHAKQHRDRKRGRHAKGQMVTLPWWRRKCSLPKWGRDGWGGVWGGPGRIGPFLEVFHLRRRESCPGFFTLGACQGMSVSV